MTTDVLQDNTIRQGSIVLQPSRSASFAATKAQRTRNEYNKTQPVATDVEAKYTGRFDERGYYFTPSVIDGNP
jgi:hypothetical protein